MCILDDRCTNDNIQSHSLATLYQNITLLLHLVNKHNYDKLWSVSLLMFPKIIILCKDGFIMLWYMLQLHIQTHINIKLSKLEPQSRAMMIISRYYYRVLQWLVWCCGEPQCTLLLSSDSVTMKNTTKLSQLSVIITKRMINIFHSASGTGRNIL